MKYYLIAGEASGDLHGSNLIKQIHELDSTANIRCWGGQMMQTAGATVVKDYKDLAFMGYSSKAKQKMLKTVGEVLIPLFGEHKQRRKRRKIFLLIEVFLTG